MLPTHHRKIVDLEKNKSGNGAVTWYFFDVMNQYLGGQPSIRGIPEGGAIGVPMQQTPAPVALHAGGGLVHAPRTGNSRSTGMAGASGSKRGPSALSQGGEEEGDDALSPPGCTVKGRRKHSNHQEQMADAVNGLVPILKESNDTVSRVCAGMLKTLEQGQQAQTAMIQALMMMASNQGGAASGGGAAFYPPPPQQQQQQQAGMPPFFPQQQPQPGMSGVFFAPPQPPPPGQQQDGVAPSNAAPPPQQQQAGVAPSNAARPPHQQQQAGVPPSFPQQ
jgi:hypothetical protein